MRPADEYVSDFVAGISRLKIVQAHAVMQPLDAYRAENGEIAQSAPRVKAGEGLSRLIEQAIEYEQPILVEDGGVDVGVITRQDLLRAVSERAEM